MAKMIMLSNNKATVEDLDYRHVRNTFDVCDISFNHTLGFTVFSEDGCPDVCHENILANKLLDDNYYVNTVYIAYRNDVDELEDMLDEELEEVLEKVNMLYKEVQ